MPMPEVILNCYSFPNIENSDEHSQGVAIYLMLFIFVC